MKLKIYYCFAMNPISNHSISKPLRKIGKAKIQNKYWRVVSLPWLLCFSGLVVPFEKRIYNRLFPDLGNKRGVIIPPYDDAVYNGSLMFLYSHPSIGTPFRLPQNAKYVGGYHVDTKVKALPKVRLDTKIKSKLNKMRF